MDTDLRKFALELAARTEGRETIVERAELFLAFLAPKDDHLGDLLRRRREAGPKHQGGAGSTPPDPQGSDPRTPRPYTGGGSEALAVASQRDALLA